MKTTALGFIVKWCSDCIQKHPDTSQNVFYPNIEEDQMLRAYVFGMTRLRCGWIITW